MDFRKFSILFFIIICFTFDNGPAITKLAKVVMVLGAAATFFSAARASYSKLFIVWNVAILALSYASIQWSFSPSMAKFYLPTIAYVCICNGAMYYVMTQEDEAFFNRVLRCCVAGAMTMSLYVLLMTGGSFIGTSVRKVEEAGLSLNIVGMVAALALIIAVYLRNNPDKNNDRVKYTMISLFLILVVLISGSRKALMLPVIAYIVQRLLAGGTSAAIRNSLLVGSALLIGMFLLMNVPILYDVIGYRVEGMIAGYGGNEDDADGSTATRMFLVEFGMEQFHENPIWGYGLANFRALLGYYHPGMTAYYAHNNYVELLVDWGVVGTIVYYTIYLLVIKKLYHIYRKKDDAMALCMLSIIISLVIAHYGFVAYYSLFNNILLTLAAYYAFSKDIDFDNNLSSTEIETTK